MWSPPNPTFPPSAARVTPTAAIPTLAAIAQALGRTLAADIERDVGLLPRAEVYSAKPLAFGAPLVTEVRLGNSEAPLYRYDGLRLLVLSGGRFFLLHDFLLHDGWKTRNGIVVVLPDDDSIRLEFRR